MRSVRSPHESGCVGHPLHLFDVLRLPAAAGDDCVFERLDHRVKRRSLARHLACGSMQGSQESRRARAREAV